MRIPLALAVLTTVALAQAQPRAGGPTVVLTTGRIHVLGNERGELHASLSRADRFLYDAMARIGRSGVETQLGNARNRLDNVMGFLALNGPPEADHFIIPKEGQEGDPRLADAVETDRLVVVEYETVQHELDRAENNVRQALGRMGRHQGTDLVNRALAEIRRAKDLLTRMQSGMPLPPPRLYESFEPPPPDARPDYPQGYPPAGPPPQGWRPPPAPPVQAQVQPMAEPAFQSLLWTVTRERWPEDKLRIVETAAPNSLFTVNQVIRLMQAFELPHHRLRVAWLTRTQIVDRDQMYQLQSVLEGSFDKEETTRVLQAQGPFALQPIDPRAFETLKQRVRAAAYPSEMHRVLVEEAQRSWFVVAQVRGLAELFAFPNDRFRVLEIVRPRLLDPANYQQLEPLFAFPNDKQRVRTLLWR